MVLLFAALSLKIIPEKAVSDVGGFLVSLLPLLFVPPLVSLLDHWNLIKDDLVAILAIILVSTVLVFAVSGWVTQWLTRKKGDDDHA
jgi:holin-like protein